MDYLIPINYDGDTPTISGRELHRELGVDTPYHKWFPRMCEYGFEEERDFWTKMSESTGGRPATDHLLSLNMAKEISMIQRNEAGKRIRQYLIQVENEWNSPMHVMSRALIMANKEIERFKSTIGELEGKVEQQRQTIEDYKPKVDYLDTILSCPDAVTTTQIAADYDLSAKRLNRILHEEGLQRCVGGQWILYHKHMGKGYTKSETIQITHRDGTSGVAMQTKWTQKGRVAIYEILKSRGITPKMDLAE